MTSPFGETVTLLTETPSGRDGDGNMTYTPVEMDVPGSVFAPAGTTELHQGQTTIIENPSIYLGLVDTDGDPVVPKATDKVRRSNGEVYDIDGQPLIFPPNPFTGEQVGPVLRLERVTG